MKQPLVALWTVVMVIFLLANAVSSSRLASIKIIHKMRQELDTLQRIMNNVLKGKCQQVVTKEAYGAVYTRWGHDNCPVHTRLVYSGYAGGAHYKNTGGAADYLCLTRNVKQSADKRIYVSFGFIYGAEYHFGRYNAKDDHDVPCAVCQSVRRSNHIMLPGSDICPKGWHREYKGLLMSGAYDHTAASQYVCVDNEQRTIQGGHGDQNGKMFYVVKTRCGCLKCPPYKHNKLVTCSVCTR